MDSSQRTLALRLADALDELDSAFSATGVCGEAVALLRELAAEPKCNPTLTECPRCGNRADMQDSHCVMRGGTVMGKPFAVENPSARRTEPEPEPERVPLTSERAIEIVYDEYGCERHGIDLVRAVERAHGIGDAK